MTRIRILIAVAVLALGGLTACQPAAFDVIHDDNGRIMNGKRPITVIFDDPETPIVEDDPSQPPMGGGAPPSEAYDPSPVTTAPIVVPPEGGPPLGGPPEGTPPPSMTTLEDLCRANGWTTGACAPFA